MSTADRVWTIRRATPADGPPVCRFVLAAFDEYGVEPDLEDKDADLMRFGRHGPEVDEFVAEIDGIAVGSVIVAPRPDGVGWLSKFFVDRARRGLGIGRALLERAVEAARERGFRRLRLDTRSVMVEAVHIYETSGWRRIPPPEETGCCDRYYELDLAVGAPQG